MGVAGSRASELDAGETRPSVRTPRNVPVSASHMSQGIKRRQTDEVVLRSPKWRKAFREPGSHQHVDLVIRFPALGRSSVSGRRCAAGIAASASPRTEVPPANDSTLSADDLRSTTIDHVTDHSQANVASPQFQRTIRSLREQSEELPSGWAVAIAPPFPESQRHHNLAMVRRAVASLSGVHLTSSYTEENLQLSTTVMPVQSMASRSRTLRRPSVQPSGLTGFQRRSRIAQTSDPVPSTSVPLKRPYAEGTVGISRSGKRVLKASVGSKQSQSANRHVSKLKGLWREDDWSGWSGILRTGF